VVRNPRRDVPIATCCGVLIAGVGYVLSCTVMTGLFAAAELRALSAPFAAALARAGAATFGVGADVVVAAVGLCAAAGGAGSLAGWMLVLAPKQKKSSCCDGSIVVRE
jgi:cadaverine:lysine antiporter